MTDSSHGGERPRSAASSFSLVGLAAHHPVDAFTCGSRPGAAEIDEYVKISALPEQSAGLSAVWVALDSREGNAGTRIVGYFTLSPLSIPLSPALLTSVGLSEVPCRKVGGYLLGRLGVAARFQGQNLGAALVAAAIKIARQVRDDAGGAFLAVDPKSQELLAWYEKLDFGFRRLDPVSRRQVLRL